MGKLLFVNTNRTYGIFGLLVCLGAVVTGVWLAIGGDYIYLALVPVGLFGAKFFLKLTTLRTELYEQGFISRNIFSSISGRYADLKSISRGAVRVNGVLNTTLCLTTQAGERVLVTEESLRQDNKMAQLLNCSCGAMASAWMKLLERQKEVPWIVKDSKPILKIRQDGIIVEGKIESDGFVPFSELQLQPGFALAVHVCRGDRKILATDSGAANYFVGQALITMLAENRRAVGATAK